MMSMKKLLRLVSVILFLSVSMMAQAQNRVITGRLVDEKNEPMAFANVVLHASDSTYITGMASNTDGGFELPLMKNAKFISISYVGYETIFKDIIDGSDFSVIQMRPNTTELEEVVVMGRRAMTQIKGDALVTHIQGGPLQNVGTANDVLGKIPGVIKNGNSIEVIGKGTPLIFINGRQVRNDSELDQLASAQIKNIEVVSPPGAKYDATVNAVIRITTLKPIGEGFGIDNRTMLGVRHYFYGLDEINLNYRKDGFDVFGMMEYENNRDRQFTSTVQNTYSTRMMHQKTEIQRFTRAPHYAGKIGFNYMPNNNHSFGLLYDFSYRPSDIDDESESDMWIDDVLSDNLNDDNDASEHNRNHILSGYYAGKFGKWSVDANIDVMYGVNDRIQNINEVSMDVDANAFSTNNDVINRLVALKAVATKTLWKGTFSFGTEWSHVNRADVYNSGNDMLSDSNAKVKENNTAAFVELSQSFGKLMLMAGLRYEHTDNSYYEYGIKMEQQSLVYNDLFPSVMASYPLGKVNTRLSYSRKITRPAFSQLNSNIEYINRYTYQSGNPFLKPSYRDYLSFSANYKWLMLMVDFTHYSDYIMSVYTEYPENPEIALLKKENSKSYNEFQAVMSLSPTFGIYHPTLMGAVRVQSFEMNFCGNTIQLDKPIGIIRLNNAIQLLFDVWMNADFSWRTSGNAENMELGSSHQIDLSVYKSFANDSWSIKVQCDDLLNSASTDVVLKSDIREFKMKKILDTRNLSITVRYKFNTTKSKYKGTGAGQEQKSRL